MSTEGIEVSVFQLGESPWTRAGREGNGLSEFEEVEEAVPSRSEFQTELQEVSETISRRAAGNQEARDNELVTLCRNYFYLGCFALPFVHWLNVWYFFPELRKRNLHPAIHSYIRLSIAVGLVWTSICIVWLIVYQAISANSSSGINSISILSVPFSKLLLV